MPEEQEIMPETWVNQSRGAVGIVRLDPVKGTDVELIRSGRKFHITPAERRLTEEKVTRAKNNPFRNGQFTLVEATDDTEFDREDEPNLISKEEIEALLTGNVNTMEKRLAKITSVIAIDRVLQVAEDTGAAARRLEIIRTRQEELAPTFSTGGPAGPPQREPYYDQSLAGRQAEVAGR